MSHKRKDNSPRVGESEHSEPASPQKKVQKRFCIECRYIGKKNAHEFLAKYLESQREWHVMRRYKTKRSRDHALEGLSRKGSSWWFQRYEYRAGKDPE